MKKQVLFGVSAVTLLACCILAVVQISVHRSSAVALASWPTALEVIPPLDSSVAGADVYSITGRSAQDALSRDIAAQKAEHEQDVADMWRRRKASQSFNDARMATACAKNPSLPGCPYTPPADTFFVSTDPDKAKADIYSIEGKVASDELKRMVSEGIYANLVDKYQAEVKAYNDAVAGDRRLVAACNRNPSLPGCPYTPPVRMVPQLGANPTDARENIYSVTAKQAGDDLAKDLADAKAQRMAEWYAQQAAAAAAQAAGRARIATACKNNPTLPGCPY